MKRKYTDKYVIKQTAKIFAVDRKGLNFVKAVQLLNLTFGAGIDINRGDNVEQASKFVEKHLRKYKHQVYPIPSSFNGRLRHTASKPPEPTIFIDGDTGLLRGTPLNY